MPAALIGWLLLAVGGVGLYSVATNKRITDVFAHSLKPGIAVKPIDPGYIVSTTDSGTTAASSPGGSTYNSQVPTGSAASTAIAYAQAQLGKSYIFGTAGPNHFDCSGLTMQAIKAAGGPLLPHNSWAQWVATRSRAIPFTGTIPPGALVFYGTGGKTALIHHVALSIGGGNMIEAPHTGDVVKVAAITSVSGLCAATLPLGA